MKLTSVEIHPANSTEVAVLSFRDPRAINAYNVKSILGLDADEIVSRYYGSSGSSNYYGLSLEQRMVVMKIGLNPRYSEFETFSDLRDALYRMIASSRTGKVQLQFKNGEDAVAGLTGFVTKLEAPLFEKNQEVQITFNPDEPMLKALEPVVTAAVVSPGGVTIEDNLSTAPHGFSFVVTVDSPGPSFKVTSPTDSGWSFEVIPSGGFLVGDVFYFSSEYNGKQLHIVRGSDTIYLMDKVTPGSVWPIMFPGVNEFDIFTTVGFDELSNAVTYYPTYWGV